MSTLTPVPVEPTWTAPRDSDLWPAVRAAYSVDDYSPVLVTIVARVHTATVEAKVLPGGSWWRAPNAEQRRKLLDAVLAKAKFERVPGTRGEATSANDWCWTYQIQPV